MGLKSKKDFIRFLTETLIPDLKESGHEFTAKDFERAVRYMQRDSKTIASLRRALKESGA
jgi:flagellin-specific chaperone FliS